MKQKVAFMNAFPGDTFLREFNFADQMIFLTSFREITFAIDQEVCFSFQSAVSFAILKIRTHYLCAYRGAPARAKRAWDRAPYSWNMVNLFWLGCHVTDRAQVRTYVRVYRLQGQGRGDYQKEGRGVSGVSWQVLIFYI